MNSLQKKEVARLKRMSVSHILSNEWAQETTCCLLESSKGSLSFRLSGTACRTILLFQLCTAMHIVAVIEQPKHFSTGGLMGLARFRALVRDFWAPQQSHSSLVIFHLDWPAKNDPHKSGSTCLTWRF